jgi:plasmid stability protein
MASLLIKNIPETLHKKLKEEAKIHRRSMIQEVITILEQSLLATHQKTHDPIQGKKPITQEILTKAIREGRT